MGARLDLALADLAARQYGVVSREQLRGAGMSNGAIERRVARGQLQRLHRGVYAVGHQALRPEALWMAAVLAGGAAAVLSHRSAAAAWELLPPRAAAAERLRGARVDVTVPGKVATRQASLEAHRSHLDPADITRRGAIPITTIPRTLLDYAEAMTRSELERRAIALLRAHALPAPDVNARRCGHEVDLSWPERRLVVELDGRAFHATAAAFERDRRRDADLQARGWRVLRFSWLQIVQDPGWVARRVADVLA